MAGLILSHLVNGVMDSIQAQLFCSGSKFLLAVASAVLSGNPQLQVFLGVSVNYFAQQLGKLSSMLCLLVSGFLVVQTDLRIASRWA